jgi:hypothetical protein
MMRAMLILILVIAGATACRTTGDGAFRQVSGDQVVESQRIPRLEIPPADWEPLFFEALGERIKRVNLPSLRTVPLHGNDLEIRFWYDGRPDIINGFVICRSGDEWSAFGIRQTGEQQISSVKKEPLKTPKSGWDAAWKRFLDAGILTLPDGSTVNCPTEIYGGAFVVETNVNGTYRTYRYTSPQFAQCDEAKRILLIEEIFADEFGLDGTQK